MADAFKIDFGVLNVKLNNEEQYHTEVLGMDEIHVHSDSLDKNFPGRLKFEMINYKIPLRTAVLDK